MSKSNKVLFNKTLPLAGYVTIFLLTRLVNLSLLPVFVDEGLHVSRALKIAETRDFLHIINGNGKYLPIWLYSFFVSYLPDPLWAGRFLSTLSSLIVALGLILLGQSLFQDKKTGWIAAGLYLISPIFLFHDRMALTDSFLVALTVYTFVVSLKWLNSNDWKWNVILGIIIGAGAITKLYGILLIMTPVLVTIFLTKNLGNPSTSRNFLKKMMWVSLVALIVMWPIYYDLATHLKLMTSKTDGGIQNINISQRILPNIGLASNWLLVYFKPIYFSFITLAIISTLYRPRAKHLLLLIISLLWMTFFVITAGSEWYPRYLLPALPPLFLLTANQITEWSAWVANRIGKKSPTVLQWGMVGIIAISVFQFNLTTLTNPVEAPLPDIDRWQYIEGWPSGYGLADLIDYFYEEATRENGQIIVVRDEDIAPLQQGLAVLLDRNQDSIIMATFNLSSNEAEEWAKQAVNQQIPIYLVIDPVRDPLSAINVEPLQLERTALFPKPGGQTRFEVYRVLLP